MSRGQFDTSFTYLNGYIGYESPFELQYIQESEFKKIIPKTRKYISADNLPSFGTPEQTRFMKKVYEIQRRHTATKRKFIDSLPSSMLDEISHGIQMRKDAALACRSLLKKAEEDLSVQKKNNISNSKTVQKIGIISGYRDANKQFGNWRSFFENKYYPQTRQIRSQKEGGEHGDSAAKFLAAYIGKRLGSPGYSYHNDGLAIDFFTQENGIRLSADTKLKNISRWRKSWFFDWLSKHASNFGFFQNTRINEPWHWEYRQNPSINKESSSSSLSTEMMLEDTEYVTIDQETEYVTIDQETEYVTIDLKIGRVPDVKKIIHYTPPKTGIYIPPSFIRGSNVNIILYLHGFKFGFPDASATIDKYWNSKKFPFFAFREGLRKSRKNAILVGPTLGPKSQSGLLVSKGLDWYLGQVLSFLQKKSIAKEIGEVILACHSGGGLPMLKLATSNNKTKLIECWGFDCLYGGADKWLKWAMKNPNKRLYMYYYDSPGKIPARECNLLRSNIINKGINNVYVEGLKMKKTSINPHFLIPIKYWQDRLSKLNWI
jgi:LAS superfamily LD-carboxypeptidase LdcB